jgi:23S rRNA pseudouridine955/2504/2580 synthase
MSNKYMSKEVSYLEVNGNDEGQRLDNYLFKSLKGVPKSHVYRIIRSGQVRVNKKRAKPSTRLAIGDCIRLPPLQRAPTKQVKYNDRIFNKIKQNIVYDDDDFLVLNKPSGIAVHGGSGIALGVIESIRQAFGDKHYYELAHRLDRETSGCLILAKKRSALRAIHRLMEQKQIDKTYLALLAKPWQGPKSLMVDKALRKNTLQSGERMVVIDNEGKPSTTQFKLIKNFKDSCLVEALAITGRTHQIRVHAASIGHPIIGDRKYGSTRFNTKYKEIGCDRLFLHAKSIRFCLNDKNYVFNAALSDGLDVLIRETLC